MIYVYYSFSKGKKMITKKIFKIALIFIFLPLNFSEGAEYRIGLSMHDVERRIEGGPALSIEKVFDRLSPFIRQYSFGKFFTKKTIIHYAVHYVLAFIQLKLEKNQLFFFPNIIILYYIYSL